MATSMRDERQKLRAEYGTGSFKKAAKVDQAREASLGTAMQERAADVAGRAAEQARIANAMAPGGARGAMQTIRTGPATGQAAGAQQAAARSAAGGAQSAAQQAATRVQQQAAGQLRERYGLQAQDAARQRVAAGLGKAGEATFAEQLAQGAIQGAVQGGISAGTTAATGGLSQLTGVVPEGFKAVQK